MLPYRSLRFFLTAIAALAVALTSSATEAQPYKEPKPYPRTLSLAASGTVKTSPDIVNISTGVTSEGPTAEDALSKNTEAMTEVVATLKGAGVEGKDIQTTNFSVSPIYERKKNNEASVITGYRVSNRVDITVRDIDTLGDVLDKTVAAGANTINSIQFGVADPEKMKDEARKLAMQNAINKAKLYADAAGVELGPVITITETGAHTPRPLRARATTATMVSESNPVPVEGGTLSIEGKVRVTWALQ